MKSVDESLNDDEARALRRYQRSPFERIPLGVSEEMLRSLVDRGLLEFGRIGNWHVTWKARRLLAQRRKERTMTTTKKTTTPALSTTHRKALEAFATAGATMDRPAGVHHATPKALIGAGLLQQTMAGRYRVTAKGKKALATPLETATEPAKTKTAKKAARKTGIKAKAET